MNKRYNYPSGNKKRQPDGAARGVVAACVVLALCAVIVLVAILATNRHGDSGVGRETEASPSDSVSQSASDSQSSSSGAQLESRSESQSESGAASGSASASESASQPASSESTGNENDKWGTSGLSREYFEDSGGSHGSWYPGLTVRDLTTGVVTYKWDRYKSTLDTLTKYGAIYRKNTDKKVAYLTFDSGFDTGATTVILDTLKEKGVKAIFFLTGDYIERPEYAELVKRMVNEGHLVGSHTYNHKNMPTLDDDSFVWQLQYTEQLLNEVLGYNYTMTFFRPPEGATCERDLYLAKKLGYTTVLWSAAYADFYVDNQPDPAESLTLLKTKLHDGCVYLLHTVSSTNAEILGDLIDYIHSEGYTIPRIDE